MAAGYKGHSIWDEEQDKYESGKHDKDVSVDYSKSDDYHGNAKSDYHTGETEEKKEKELTPFEKAIEENNPKKYDKKEDESITKKAADQVFTGVEETPKQRKAKTKDIEDAIRKAMKEEKELIFID
ncbi:MAG: hypothetical protein KJ922_06370 [Nanoarchaeota archaeon]|nr:hypothetical protein [Nanoarchaeota archaeon]